MSEEISKVSEASIRFNLCRFRSDESEKRVIQRCKCQGGPYTVDSYICKKRNIAHVTEKHCEACPFFKSKEEGTLNESP